MNVKAALYTIQCSHVHVKVQLPLFSPNYWLSRIKLAKLENSQYDCSGPGLRYEEIHQI